MRAISAVGALHIVSLVALAACSGADPSSSDLTRTNGSPDAGKKSGGSSGSGAGGTSGSGTGATGDNSNDGGAPSTGASSSDDAGSDTSVVPSGDAGSGKGYLHTKGGQIVDESGATVRLTGLSWFGFETSNYVPHGLWTRGLDSMLDQIKSLGFNSIRIPYTNQMFDAGSTPNGIDTSKNPTLVGKTSLQILDAIIDGAEARGLRIILDRHRPDSSAQSELWYTGSVSEQRWIDDWKMLATRYKGRSTVTGFDLHNEPHGSATWGDGNTSTDWRLAAERAGTAVQAINPDLLIIVEGIENAGGTSYWWGGNLRNAAASPVRLPVADHLVYSPHDYPASVYSQPWFSAANYPANLPSVWDAAWGYLAKGNTAPIWIGEFGTKNQTTVDQAWLKGMASYVQQSGMSFSYWSWNPDSGDTGGILQDDWQTVNTDKVTAIAPALAH